MFFIHPGAQLAPQALFASAGFVRIPLGFTFDLDVGRINWEMQQNASTMVWDADVKPLLTRKQSTEFWHVPLKPCQAQGSFEETGRLPKGYSEQPGLLSLSAELEPRINFGTIFTLQRQAKFDRDVAKLRLARPIASRSCLQRRLRITPNRKRTALFQRRIIRPPVFRLIFFVGPTYLSRYLCKILP